MQASCHEASHVQDLLMVYINSKAFFGIRDWNEAVCQLRHITVCTHIQIFEIQNLNNKEALELKIMII